jgi:hypothetical protein
LQNSFVGDAAVDIADAADGLAAVADLEVVDDAEAAPAGADVPRDPVVAEAEDTNDWEVAAGDEVELVYYVVVVAYIAEADNHTEGEDM